MKPLVITPTESGVFLVPLNTRPHGAFLVGRVGRVFSYDRHVVGHVHTDPVPLPITRWHQPN